MVDRPQVTVDASGIFIPSYQDWLSYLQETYRSIYGPDIYIEADSQDGQLLAVFAQALFDTGNACGLTYNDFSPATAIGAGLSSVIKVNGIRRQIATNSTAVVTIVGQPGVQIPAGSLVGDNLNLNTRWVLPAVIVPPDGDIDVTVTCQTQGNVTASANTLTNIVTSVPGWQTVTNANPAVPGAPVETDAALRQRQSRSASLPADTTLNGIYAAVANVLGVTRAEVYQNDTNIPDANGIPGHTIAVVVEGGNSGDIASAIALKKPPGIAMEGNTTVVVVDSRGVPDTIKYYTLDLSTMRALIFYTALTGYVSTTADLVRASVSQFYNDQLIGQDVYISRVFAPANLTGESAQTATSFTQAQLDALGRTYHITNMGIGNDGMTLTGTIIAGATSMDLLFTDDLVTGQTIWINLDDNSHHQAIITSVTAGINPVLFTPAIPVGRSASFGAQVYVVGDVTIEFNGAAFSTVDDIVLEVS